MAEDDFQARMKAIIAKQQADDQQKLAADQAQQAADKKIQEQGPSTAEHCYKELKERLKSEVAGFDHISQTSNFGGVLEFAVNGKRLLAIHLTGRELIICVYPLPLKPHTERIGNLADSYVYYELTLLKDNWVWQKAAKKANPRDIGDKNLLVPYNFRAPKNSILTQEQMQNYCLDMLLLMMQL